MDRRLRVLILGGYGNFGGRLTTLLANEPDLTVLVAGRSLDRATAFLATLPPGPATLIAAVFDREGDLDEGLNAARPDILIDASGPFQVYGDAPWRVVEACIRHRVHYLDLADGTAFVTGISAFDAQARAAGVFALSGVSSCPALTAAVVRRLSGGLARIDTILGGIAPSPKAGIGENVMRAIASYAGKPVARRRDGAPATGYPLTEHMEFTIAPAGHEPLAPRRFSLVDVPDLTLLPELWPEVKTVWLGAGFAPALTGQALVACAWLVRWGLLPNLTPLVPLMRIARHVLRWGAPRGGMFVAIEGADPTGLPVKRAWHLLAEGDDGPFIPAMVAVALIRRILSGRHPPPGARPAIDDLTLEDFAPLFAQRAIHTAIRDTLPLYPRVLGSLWASLPTAIQAMHDGVTGATGRASVERGKNPLARLAAAVIGFPRATPDTPIHVRFDTRGETEIWTRTFGEQSFSSRQFAGTGPDAGLLREGFGPLTFTMALVPDGNRLRLETLRWRAFGIPMPYWACPTANAYEAEEAGRFHFHVEIGHPLTGLIVRYRGWLIPGTKDQT